MFGCLAGLVLLDACTNVLCCWMSDTVVILSLRCRTLSPHHTMRVDFLWLRTMCPLFHVAGVKHPYSSMAICTSRSLEHPPTSWQPGFRRWQAIIVPVSLNDRSVPRFVWLTISLVPACFWYAEAADTTAYENQVHWGTKMCPTDFVRILLV